MAIRSGLIVTNILWLLDQDLLLQKLMAIRSGLIVTNILWLLDQDLLLQTFYGY